MDRITWARELSEHLLADVLPRRWAHSQGVGRKAESIAAAFGSDGEALVAAAWLHDIGYAPALAVTGFHSLDGARYLRDKTDADLGVCSLVAYHSCAQIEARNRDMGDVLAAEFEPVQGILSEAMTYCDMTTSPDGVPTDVHERLAEILERYGPGHLVMRSISEASPLIVQAAEDITEFVRARG